MCTSPNYLVWYGKYKDKFNTYKRPLDDNPILPSDFSTHIEFTGVRVPEFSFIGKQPYDRMIKLKSPWIQVPCGQCLECRIQQARTWADRVVLESKKYNFNYFVTLTYDDDHLPSNWSLVPDDLSKFIRSLRDKFKGTDVKIRFFGCGEYGDISRRPHYHVILFNCPLNDLSYEFKQAQFIKNDKGELIFKRLKSHIRPNNSGDLMYSETIHKSWLYKGQISVGKVTYDSAAYVSQYVTKKHKPGMLDFYKKLGVVPEFVRMSTHPGIAADYFNERDDYLLFDGHMIVDGKGEAHISSCPRYFEKLFIKKYGENVFIPIRSKRINERVNILNKNCSLGINKDHVAKARDYKIKQIHHLKTQL